MKDKVEIYMIAEVTLEAFEKRLLDLQARKEIIDTFFEDYRDVYFARVMCRDKKHQISEVPKRRSGV